MSEQLRDEIRESLKGAGVLNLSNDVLSRCVGLASTLHIGATQIAECWEAHSLNKNLKSLDEHSFAGFRSQLIKTTDSNVFLNETADGGAVVRSAKKKHEASGAIVTPAPNKRQHVDGGSASSSSSSGNQQSGNRRVSMSPHTPQSTGNTSTAQASMYTYENRKGSGTVVTEYNPAKLQAAPTTTDLSRARCRVNHDFATNVTEAYRHYFTVIDERAVALDNRLLEMHDEFAEQFKFGTGDLADLEAVNVPRQDKICCIGRVCNAAHEGRINAASVLLEGSRHLSGGARVELDLAYMKAQKQAFSLFPGQVVAVEGMNCSGRKLVAQRICEGAPHTPNKSTVGDLLKFHHSDDFQGGQPIKIISAAGPFTCSDNLDYLPLTDLIQEVIRTKPDIVILTGPFVDVRHKDVAGGQPVLKLDENDGSAIVPYEVLFADNVSRLLAEFYNEYEMETQFVLVPSLEDATAEWVYPQPPFADRRPVGRSAPNIPGSAFDDIQIGSLGLDSIENNAQRIHCLSNPCTLQINEIVIGVTGTDVLFHLNADETNAHLETGSRMTRIAQHMLQQQSYYPLFPASLEMNMDLKRMEQWSMPCAPDILILPSKLGPFCKSVLDDSAIIVNPGLLTKATTGGTYAVMTVYPMPRETLENAGGDNVELRHNLYERTTVEVKRI